MLRRAAVVLSAGIMLLSAACSRPVDVPPPASTASGSTSTTTPVAATPSNHLRIGIPFTQPGVGLRADGSYSGMDVDVARYVASQLGARQVTFVEAVPDQRETLLASGQVDMVISTYSISDERSEKVTFAGPYLVTGQDLLVRRKSKIRTLAQLRGHTLCSATGSASTAALVEDHPGLHLVEEPTVAACVQRLKDGDVEAVTSDAAILTGFARASQGADRLVLARRPFTREAYGVGLPLGSVERCKQVRVALARMERSGEWRKAMTDNFPATKDLGRRSYTAPALLPCPAPASSSSTTSTTGGTTA